jgi:pimeloyl-ACP methyl ester carboxylesterase
VRDPGGNDADVPRESFVEVRGLRLCVLSWGPQDGPIVVCLHGMLDHAGSMAEVARRLARRGLRVIAPDLRGHGRSGHVGAGGSYHLVDFVADVDALARTLGPARFTLVGHSLGASIAALFAGVRPDRLAALVLVEAALPTEARGSDADRLATHLDYLASPQVHAIYPDLVTAAERVRAVTPISPAQALAVAHRLTEPCDGGVRWRWDPLLRTRAGLTFHGVELPPERFRALIGGVRCPVTWVHGDASELPRVAGLAIPGLGDRAREVVLRGGHHLHLDNPAELAELIAAAAGSPTP